MSQYNLIVILERSESEFTSLYRIRSLFLSSIFAYSVSHFFCLNERFEQPWIYGCLWFGPEGMRFRSDCNPDLARSKAPKYLHAGLNLTQIHLFWRQINEMDGLKLPPYLSTCI